MTMPAAPATLLQQPAFDQRMRGLSNPFGIPGTNTVIDRGFMIWDITYAANYGYSATNPPSVSFLFNPSTVQASYQLSNTSAQAADLFGVAAQTSPVTFTSLQQQVSFSIMFDRTYELWDKTTYGINSMVDSMGCEIDVRQMKQFTGMFASGTVGGIQVGGTNPNGANIFNTGGGGVPSTGNGIGPQQGLMIMVPSYVFFGPLGTTVVNNGTSMYYGYVSAWSVQYTHYTSAMVPIRCVVDISFTLLPNGASANVPPG